MTDDEISKAYKALLEENSNLYASLRASSRYKQIQADIEKLQALCKHPTVSYWSCKSCGEHLPETEGECCGAIQADCWCWRC